MQTLTMPELGIASAVYLGVILLSMLLLYWTKFSYPFWSLFNSSSIRLVSIIILLVTAGSVSLFYNDAIAYVVVPLIFLVAAVIPLVLHSQRRASGWITMIITLLFLMFSVPVTITLLERGKMSDTLSVGVLCLIAGFWLIGLLLATTIKSFREEVRPFAHSRSLLILLALSFYIIWFAAKSYSVPTVAILASIAMVMWLANGNNLVMSAELETYHRGVPYETAFLTISLVFVVVLNLATSMSKETNLENKTVYLFNIILFGLTMAVLASIATISILRNWKSSNRSPFQNILETQNADAVFDPMSSNTTKLAPEKTLLPLPSDEIAFKNEPSSVQSSAKSNGLAPETRGVQRQDEVPWRDLRSVRRSRSAAT